MTYKQLRDLIRPMYDEADHKANSKNYIFKESVDTLDAVLSESGTHTKHMDFQRAARMNNFVGHAYPSSAFSFHKEDKTFTSEISDTKGVLGRVWNDSADVGFAIRSAKTDNIVVFTLEKEHKDREGDITHWDFEVYNPKNYPELKGLKATVFND